MENKQRIRPLTPTERKFAEEKYHLITDFLKRSKLDVEEFFDIVVFDFLLSVKIYLSSEDSQKKCDFKTFSCMYMKRGIYRHFREQKTLKRTGTGADVSFDEMDAYIGKSIKSMEDSSSLEYEETIKQIESILTLEQQRIFFDNWKAIRLKR